MKEVFHVSSCSWQLKGTSPYVPIHGKSMETGAKLEGITAWIPATVPGGVSLALYRAGYIEHPYWGMNSLKCEWVENKWWIYQTSFQKPVFKNIEKASEGNKKIRLVFHGVDYDCMVYLNDQFLGEHVGMYEPFSFDITSCFHQAQTFTLRVLIKHAPDEIGQIGRTSEVFTQKSRFNYKWDFSTRLVNLGIWKDVDLVAEDSARIEDLQVTSTVDDVGLGIIQILGEVFSEQSDQDFILRGLCTKDGVEIVSGLTSVQAGERFCFTLQIQSPELWYPNGIGSQTLYDLQVLLESKTENTSHILDQSELKIGIRKMEYLQNEGSAADSFPYTFVVNGQKLYIKGVNLTPLDHIYGDIPEEMVAYVLRRAAEMNVNMVRVWGGGLIESKTFYQLCDQLGLLVWQEFIQSSSGIDNVPSKDRAFQDLLCKSALAAVKEKRNHTCLTVWSGGNELMQADNKPATLEDETIALLHKIVMQLDPERLFLPTSASGPSEFISSVAGESHDVHGWWQYQGNPRHYEFYHGSDSLFHSEFGCDGLSSLQTLRKIFPQPELVPTAMHRNDLWRFHGDWWCTFERETTLFGPMSDIEEFINCSQWIQAEGLRAILETNQRRKFHNSGSIIWQLNEPWPNASCTSLIEYYGTPKMAYYWAKNAFSAFHASLYYPKLDYAQGEEFHGMLHIFTDTTVPAGTVELVAEVIDLHNQKWAEQCYSTSISSNESKQVGELVFTIPPDLSGLFLVRIRGSLGNFQTENSYYFSTKSVRPYEEIKSLSGGVLSASFVSNEDNKMTLTVTNTGSRAVLHVHVEDSSDCFNLFLSENYFTLLPQETKSIQVHYCPKFRFGFDEYASNKRPLTPDLVWKGIGAESRGRI